MKPRRDNYELNQWYQIVLATANFPVIVISLRARQQLRPHLAGSMVWWITVEQSHTINKAHARAGNPIQRRIPVSSVESQKVRRFKTKMWCGLTVQFLQQRHCTFFMWDRPWDLLYTLHRLSFACHLGKFFGLLPLASHNIAFGSLEFLDIKHIGF